MLLNPGGGGKNVANFSNLELSVLFVRGTCLLIFAAANLFPFRAKREVCTADRGSWETICYFAFALVFGFLDIYSVMTFGQWS